MSSDLKFLVWLDREMFLTDVYSRGSGAYDVSGTKILSAAKHFDSYEEAEHWCQLLRRRFPTTVVTDQRGAAITADKLQAEPAPRLYDLPRNNEEIDRIPSPTLRKRMADDPVFRERVFNIWNGIVKC